MERNKFLILVVCLFSFSAYSQNILSWSQALDSAMAKNPDLIQARKFQTYQNSKVATALDLPATQFLQEFTRGVAVNVPWQSTITQSGEWPGVYKAQRDIYQSEAKMAGWTLKDKQAYIQKSVLLAQMNYAATTHLLAELRHWDSLWNTGVVYSELRVRLGESALLESKTIQQQQRLWQTLINKSMGDSLRYLNEWRQLCGCYSAIPSSSQFQWNEVYAYPNKATLEHPYLMQWNSANIAAEQQVQLEKAKLFPSWNIGFQHYPATPMNTMFLGGKDAKAYVIMAGWSLPIFTRGQMARVKQAREGVQYLQASKEAEQSRWLNNYRIAFAEYVSTLNNITLFQNSLVPEARQVLSISAEQYKLGNISYLEWLMLSQQNIQTISNYWQALPELNQKALELHYLNTNN
jgi:cobalt-zinc-cadmium resistance protein CzcA